MAGAGVAARGGAARSGRDLHRRARQSGGRPSTSRTARFTLNAQRASPVTCSSSSPRSCNRQEVATWKKVIRVISHELNNSLAPMSSLAHSGRSSSRGNPSREARADLLTPSRSAQSPQALHRRLPRASPSCRDRSSSSSTGRASWSHCTDDPCSARRQLPQQPGYTLTRDSWSRC